MLNEDNKILKYSHGEKLMKVFFLLLMLTQSVWKYAPFSKQPQKIWYRKKYIHTPSGYSLSTKWSFDPTKDMLDCYRGKDCMEKFCKDLKEHATKIINYKKKRNDTTNWWRK